MYEGLRAFADPAARTGVGIIGLKAHVQRMQSGLDEAGIAFDAAALAEASFALLAANGLTEAFIYWQVTRGTPVGNDPPRTRVPPASTAMRPTSFAYASALPALAGIVEPPIKKVVTLPDIRWELGHLKSISLMGNVMTALRTAELGGDEAIMYRRPIGEQARPLVSEGLATNVVCAFRARGGSVEIATPRLKVPPILSGVTRRILLRECPEIVERDIAVEELSAAEEVMLIGTTTLVTAVTHVDGRPVHGGSAGPAARALFSKLMDAVRFGRDEF